MDDAMDPHHFVLAAAKLVLNTAGFQPGDTFDDGGARRGLLRGAARTFRLGMAEAVTTAHTPPPRADHLLLACLLQCQSAIEGGGPLPVARLQVAAAAVTQDVQVPLAALLHQVRAVGRALCTCVLEAQGEAQREEARALDACQALVAVCAALRASPACALGRVAAALLEPMWEAVGGQLVAGPHYRDARLDILLQAATQAAREWAHALRWKRVSLAATEGLLNGLADSGLLRVMRMVRGAVEPTYAQARLAGCNAELHLAVEDLSAEWQLHQPS